MRNWQTTLIGVAVVFASIYSVIVRGIDEHSITLALVGVGLIKAKDA